MTKSEKVTQDWRRKGGKEGGRAAPKIDGMHVHLAKEISSCGGAWLCLLARGAVHSTLFFLLVLLFGQTHLDSKGLVPPSVRYNHAMCCEWPASPS